MLIYFIIFFIISIIGLLSLTRNNQEYKKKAIIFITSLLIVLQAIRSSYVGIDLPGYLHAYEVCLNYNFIKGDTYQNYELGYSLLMQLLKSIGLSEQLFISFISCAIIIPVAVTISRYSQYPITSLMMYYTMGLYVFSFSGLRQSIAIGIVFLSYRFILDRKLIPFTLLILLAMSFHLTAIIFFPAYFLFHVQIGRREFVFVLLLTALLFIYRTPLFRLIYRIYKGSTPTIEYTGAYSMLALMLIIYIISFIFSASSNIALNGNRNFLLISIMIQVFTSQSNVIGRAGYYYYIFVLLLIPEMLKYIKKKDFLLVEFSAYLFMLFFFWWTSLRSGYLDIVPYTVFWK